MKRIFIVFLVLVVLTISCKKKETGPSIYNFKVIDIYSGLPVANAKAVLRNSFWPYETHDITIGYTNSNGEFQYICDKESDHTPGYYSYYSIYFISHNGLYIRSFSIPNSIEVTQTHETNNYTFPLLQSSTICLRTRRVSTNLVNNFCAIGIRAVDKWRKNENLWHSIHFFNDSIGQIHDTCLCIPSNDLEIIESYIEYNCNNIGLYSWTFESTIFSVDSLNIGYNETIFFNIDY